MITDFHVHSEFSIDSEAPLEAMVEEALRRGVQVLCFTDHCDIGPEDFESWGPPDFPREKEKVARLREKYPEIEILVGMEAGDMHVDREAMQAAVAAQPLDFVLLSTHFVDGVDLYLYDKFIKDGVWAAYDRYLDYVLDSVQNFGDYDSLAHLGYCAKFAPAGAHPLVYEEYPEKIDAILRGVIQQGKALELNTSGFARLNAPFPGWDIVKRYVELGGEHMTFGSDTHAPDRIADHIAEAKARARELGVRYSAVYRGRKPTMEAL